MNLLPKVYHFVTSYQLSTIYLYLQQIIMSCLSRGREDNGAKTSTQAAPDTFTHTQACRQCQ
jgi:hypothetical protein